MPEKIAEPGQAQHLACLAVREIRQEAADTPDGDGSLLDHSLILYGSGMSESNTHSRLDAPTILVEGKTGNRHIRTPKETPLANLMLTIANKFGDETDKFGISTGRVAL